MSRIYARLIAVCLALAMPLSSLADDPPAIQCKPGPWGHIQYRMVYLAAPDWILDQFPMPRPQARWCFPNASATSVSEFLLHAGLASSDCVRLCTDPRSHIDQENVFTIFPSVQDIEILAPNVREAIYHELAKSPLNAFYSEPIVVPDGDVDAWLRGTNLPENVVGLIRKLVYKDNDSLLFSDFNVVLSQAQSDEQARQWVKALTRTRAVMAALILDNTDDLPALKRYWSANFHRQDSLPVLDSLTTEQRDIKKLDLIHLLPPFARQLVYSYTTPDIERSGQTPNCHWTSLNFFNYTRQNIYLDLKLAASRVLQGYEKVSGEPAFGDVLFFLNSEGAAFHSCVYVADNLVFTKNGENQMSPWLLTRLEDVKQLYIRNASDKIQIYRRKWTEPGA